MTSRYDQLRDVTARLAAPADEQIAYITSIFPERAPPIYSCDELALEFEDCFISVDHMLGDGRLNMAQAAALHAVDAFLRSLSGGQHEGFWYTDALATDPRWSEVRRLAQDAIALMPTKDG